MNAACAIGWFMIGSLVLTILVGIIVLIIQNWEDLKEFLLSCCIGVSIVVWVWVWVVIAVILVHHCK